MHLHRYEVVCVEKTARSLGSAAIVCPLAAEKIGKVRCRRGESNGDFLWHCRDQIDGGTALPHSALSHVELGPRRGPRGVRDGWRAGRRGRCACVRELHVHGTQART